MLSISHAVTGAFIATKLGNPYLAIPIILLSHYLEDAVPHWDAGTGLSSGKKTRTLAITHGIIDLVLAGIIVLAYYPSSLSAPLTIQSFIFSPAVWGAFMGLVPDFLETPRNFWKYEPAWLKPVNSFHGSFHHSIPRMWDGLAPQVLLLLALWFLK